MCGICGAVALDGELDPAIASALPAMIGALRHRGPDGAGVHVERAAALAHARLAIIDRAGGEQPLANEDRTVWIVFNGEIYNHVDLRRRLEARGHIFRTRSDTEAIVHAYEEYGPDCVTHLDGMFAFAIWDARRRELFLARDRVGKKPLFYAELGGALHFASEIKSLQASPAWTGELDLTGLEGYLSLGYFLAPATAFREVRKLPPGHTLTLREGRIEQRRYWDIEQFEVDRRSPAELALELDRTIAEAVRCRLESEVPLGAFLSGGIDSGLVVSYMRDALGESVSTTTVGFGQSTHNEIDAASKTARHLATRHYAEIAEPRLDESLEMIARGFDEPFADSSAVPTHYVCAMARRHVTVALSGDGGDESFGGYDFRYVPHALEAGARRLAPQALARPLFGLLGRHWPTSPRMPRPLRLQTVFQNLSLEPWDAYYLDLCFLKPAQTRRLLGQAPTFDPRESPVYDAVTSPYRRCTSSSLVQRAQYADVMVYLPNDVLVKVDRMSMAHGLEVRCPLLDHRVIEWAFRVPTSTKMPRMRAKHLLRLLARRRLPASVLRAPKRGFTAPVADWLRTSGREMFRADALEGSTPLAGLLDVDYLRGLFEEHQAGRRDHGYALWAAWVLARWLRQQATHKPAASAPVGAFAM